MKTAILPVLITFLFLLIGFTSFANYNFLAAPNTSVSSNDAVAKKPATSTGGSFSNAGLFNIHYSSASGTASFLDKLAIPAGNANTYHSFVGCPYANGVKVSCQLKYSALASVACVWNIGWGVKQSFNGNKPVSTNNLSVVLTISNPVSSNKPDSPLVHKIKTNIPLETLSVIDLVVTFAHL